MSQPLPVALIVEDEPNIRRMIKMSLEAANFTVFEAASVARGLIESGTRQPDVVLLDLGLPDGSGLKIIHQIRSWSDVPIIVISARALEDDKIEALDLGADDYLTKPFAFAELLLRVKALLRRGPVNRASVLRVADLEIDRLSQNVRRAGKKIELTAKEYALLEYLATNPGRVFSRTMIIEHVWDQSFQGLTNIVDVYVRHLREKVDDAHPVKLLRTVRGVGYSLNDEVPA